MLYRRSVLAPLNLFRPSYIAFWRTCMPWVACFHLLLFACLCVLLVSACPACVFCLCVLCVCPACLCVLPAHAARVSCLRALSTCPACKSCLIVLPVRPASVSCPSARPSWLPAYACSVLSEESSADVFQVEKLLRRRRKRSGFYEYRVKWQGYESKYNTWVR